MYYHKFNSKLKFGNVPSEYRGGRFQSKKEQRKAIELDLLKKAGEIKDWKKQVKEELRGENGTLICSYYCDFVIEHNDGTTEFLEIKSPITITPVFRVKWKLLLDKYKDRHDYKFTIEQ